jgi:tetraacyldisaccharide 4'-kinase
MKLNKPKFWDENINLFSILLYPLSLIILLFIYLKNKSTKIIEFKTPIICVGNIYIGGTGKTPTSIFLAKELFKAGKNPVIVRKYYKNHVDEHRLIEANFKNLILDRNRIMGIKKAENSNYDTVILDDGFQDKQIKKNLSILCFNQNQLIGNGLILPSGPLRENLNALKNADIILINGKKDSDFENKVLNINKKLDIFYSSYKPENIAKFRNKKLLALAGIGNPNNFFRLLKENNLEVEKELIFPDHYQFTKNEIQEIVDESENKDYQIIMTEKDYFKIKEFKIDKLGYLKVSLKIDDSERFIKTIEQIYAKNY